MTDSLTDLISAEVVRIVLPILRKELTAQPVKLLTVAQVAGMIGRSKSAVQHLIASGELPAVKAGRRVHVEVSEIEKWIERNRG